MQWSSAPVVGEGKSSQTNNVPSIGSFSQVFDSRENMYIVADAASEVIFLMDG